MSETPKRKSGGLPKWIIWERQYEYVVSLSVEECLTRLTALTKTRRGYHPEIYDQSEIDGTNSRLLMEFSHHQIPVYAMVHLINLDLNSTRVLIRFGFPARLIIQAIILPIILMAIVPFGMKNVERAMALTYPLVPITLSALISLVTIFVTLISYLVGRSNIVTGFKNLFEIT